MCAVTHFYARLNVFLSAWNWDGAFGHNFNPY
jgi:hypothetical protein